MPAIDVAVVVVFVDCYLATLLDFATGCPEDVPVVWGSDCVYYFLLACW